MKEEFKRIPSALQRQILLRLTGCGLGIALLLFSYRSEWRLIIPGVVIFSIFLIDAAVLYEKCVSNRYVVFRGSCEEIEYTGRQEKVKAVCIQTGKNYLKISNQIQKIRNLDLGDELEVYVYENTPMYDQDGCLVVFNVMAVKRIRTKENDTDMF